MTRSQRPIPDPDLPLGDLLQLLLPCADVVSLLQATLLEGDTARTAWLQWRGNVPNPNAFLAADRVGIKRHLPLLYRNLVTQGVEIGRDLEPYFRAARAREELRSTRFRRYLGEVLGALSQAGIKFIVGKGVTVGEAIQTDPVVRHSHDIDLLVLPESIAAAAVALRAAGFVPSVEGGPNVERRFDHESGLPVELHDRLYRTPFYDGDIRGLWSRSREGEILGVPVRLIGDADLLVHAPAHASVVSQRYGLSWIIDVMSLMQRRAREDAAIDWTTVTRIAIGSRAALPLYVMYRHLAMTYNAPIPEHLLGELRRAASRAGVLQQLAAIDGLRADPRQRRIKTIVEASGWRSRAVLARAMLLPPPAYFRARHPETNASQLMRMYVARPLRFIARQVNRFQYRLRQRWLRSRPTGSHSEVVTPGAASTSLGLDGSSTTGRSLT